MRGRRDNAIGAIVQLRAVDRATATTRTSVVDQKTAVRTSPHSPELERV
jgi:hypothetical protein